MRKFDLQRINLYTILRDYLVNLWIVILVAVTAFIGSFSYYTYVHKHNYVSTMTVSINLSGYTTNATALSLARTVLIAETLDDVFQSAAVRDVVKKDLGGEITGTISARQLSETNLVMISVIDESPEKAYNTLVSVYENYDKVTNLVFSNVIIRTVANPTMPTKPYGAMSTKMLGFISAVLAGFIVSVLIVIISYMRDTVKNVSDVERELDTRLFGTVYRVKKLGKKLPNHKRRLIVTNPLVGFDFANSFRKMAVKIESLRRTKGHNVFMVTSVTENEGKTSVAVNLAVTLQQNGSRVLLIDCDFKNPSIRRFFDDVPRPENSDFHQFITNGGDITHFIKHDPDTGLYLADNVEVCTNSAEILSGQRFTDIIKALKTQFDFIIVDTPPCGITVDPEIVSGIVDAAILTVRQDFVTVTDINDQIQNLNKCYLAGCVFNDVATFKQSIDKSSDSYINYYNRQNG